MVVGRAAIEAGRAFVRLTLDDKEFAAKLKGARTRMEAFLGSGIRKWGLLTAAIGATVGVIAKLTSHTMRLTQELTKNAEISGLTISEYAELSAMARILGVNHGALSVTLRNVGERMVQLLSRSKETADAFRVAGIDVERFLSADISQMQRLDMLAEFFQKANDRGTELGLALRTMGEAGNEFLPIIERFANIRLREIARGIIPETEDINRVAQLSKEWEVFRVQLQTIGITFVSAIEPVLRQLVWLLSEVARWAVQIGRFLGDNFDSAAASLARGLGQFAVDIGNIQLAIAKLLEMIPGLREFGKIWREQGEGMVQFGEMLRETTVESLERDRQRALQERMDRFGRIQFPAGEAGAAGAGVGGLGPVGTLGQYATELTLGPAGGVDENILSENQKQTALLDALVNTARRFDSGQ